MAIYRFAQLPSTNTRMAEMASELNHGDVIITTVQSAGRGQRGNSWEAEPGKNLTFSLLLRPRSIAPADAFLMSMAVSVGIVSALRRILGQEIVIKWPNDIYAGDRKLAGILIENSFTGRAISHAIVGIGLNVNQTVFVSDAPNPVSMAMLIGCGFDLDRILAEVTDAILRRLSRFEHNPDIASLSAEYHSMLWRRQGVFDWLDCLSGQQFRASIAGVAPSGIITMTPEDGSLPRQFAFKEIKAIIADGGPAR